MSPFFQALNIGTMAVWLTLGGASTVGCLVKVNGLLPHRKDLDLDMTLSDVVDLDNQPAQVAVGSAAPDAPTEPVETTPVEQVPAIPELPQVDPLPEIPDLPQPKPDDLQTEKPKEQARPQPAKPATKHTSAATAPQGHSGGTPGATGTGTGTGNGAVGNGSAATGGDAARFSKGSYPKPPYPDECRRNNQEGRVVITFTVDEQGNVVSAKVTGPCPYPALNQAAVQGAYRWKCPPGARGSASKAVVFGLK